MNRRLTELVALCRARRLDAYLATSDVNISYLTGCPSAESWLVVLRQGAFYLTDFRYFHEAQKVLRGVAVVCYTGSIGEAMRKIITPAKVRRIGFDSRYLSVADCRRLKKTIGARAALVCADGLVENMRAIKSADEISKIKHAVALNLKAYEFVRRIIAAGMTEQQLFDKLESFVKAKGVSFSFPPIIASGPNSSYPHARLTRRRITAGDIVLIDIGIEAEGYKSDLTRIFFLDKIPPLVKKVYMAVREAQRAAIQRITVGAKASDIDSAARDYLKKARLDRFFGHSLGHGIGCEVHESPAISARSQARLIEGMVFTVEPGVYIPHRFGIRIEDMVLVTKNGCEGLSR